MERPLTAKQKSVKKGHIHDRISRVWWAVMRNRKLTEKRPTDRPTNRLTNWPPNRPTNRPSNHMKSRACGYKSAHVLKVYQKRNRQLVHEHITVCVAGQEIREIRRIWRRHCIAGAKAIVSAFGITCMVRKSITDGVKRWVAYLGPFIFFLHFFFSLSIFFALLFFPPFVCKCCLQH